MIGNDNHPAVPWWLWPNVLGLDAPAVALAWQALFARSAGCELRGSEQLALGLAVWVIYAADRVLDGQRLGAPPGTAARHRFSRLHAGWTTAIVVFASVAGAVVVFRFLPGQIIAWGSGLAILTVFYFAWNQLSGARFGRGWAKEAVVSAVFAAGTALVPLVRLPSLPLVAGVTGFAVLCLANCLLIARLDRKRDHERGELSIATGLPENARPSQLLAGLLGAAVIAGMLVDGISPVGLCLLTSAGLIAVAGVIELHRGNEATAVWADFALLTPLAALALAR